MAGVVLHMFQRSEWRSRYEKLPKIFSVSSELKEVSVERDDWIKANLE